MKPFMKNATHMQQYMCHLSLGHESKSFLSWFDLKKLYKQKHKEFRCSVWL